MMYFNMFDVGFKRLSLGLGVGVEVEKLKIEKSITMQQSLLPRKDTPQQTIPRLQQN